MENIGSCLNESSHRIGIFKTLYLFLQSQNFLKTAKTLKEEWGLDRGDIDKVSSKSLLLARCKCSKTQANQTESKVANSKHRNDWLEGSFQNENFHLKPDDTVVFYVCDHCHKQNQNKPERIQRSEAIHHEKSPDQTSPRCEVSKLKSKFSQLHEEHKKLIVVTTELTNALQMNIIGQTKNIYAVLDHCKAIYPSLFENSSPRMHTFDEADKDDNINDGFSELQMDLSNIDRTHCTKINDGKSSQLPKSSSPLQNTIESLNLEGLSPTTPLTPETVRCVLEMVFERIFELEKYIRVGKGRNSAHDGKTPPLNKEDVENIIGDVLNDSMKSPLTHKAGEGDSRPQSISRPRNENNFLHIDYDKLKYDLIHSDNERKIRILQALRWRITKSDGPTREKVLDSYTTNDVLDLFENVSIPERFLLGYGMDHYVQESACRLINALASLRQGRDYLTLDERLLKRVLIKKVKDVRTVSGAVIRNMLAIKTGNVLRYLDSRLRNLARKHDRYVLISSKHHVASVQKLSIRKQCRSQMVNEGLFEIMIDYLDEFYEKLSKYCLEYCSALLMNLCLVEDAKNRSIKNPRKVVGLLGKFLESENDCCLPYINGVMFSLFEKPEIVNEAKRQDLDKAIVKLTQVTNNTNIKKQLEFILQSRIFGKSEQNINHDDEGNKDEVDLLEVELDQDDYITQLPSGEKLLEEYRPEGGSLTVIRKDPPNSAKSFSEETKQYLHKPSLERGIFETSKPRRYTICSQNLKNSYVGKKTFNQSYGRYPATPLCYMENCQKSQTGGECACSKCSPSQSKYACGCYEAIRRDVADNGENLDHFSSRKNVESKNGQLKAAKKSSAISKQPSKVGHNSAPAIKSTKFIANIEQSSTNDTNDGGRTTSGCKVCGEKKCECAFESRPKLCRTPTL